MNEIIKSKKFWAIAVVILVLSLAVGAAAGFYAAPQPAGVQSVRNVFVDLDKNGTVDVILSGSVILNFLGPTPTPGP